MLSTRVKQRIIGIGSFGMAMTGLCITSYFNYLLFHGLVEVLTISIGFSLFVLTWNARKFLPNDSLKILGIGYAFIAVLDLFHALAYKGMNVFPNSGANMPTQLWIAARYLQTFTLCLAPLFIKRKANDFALVSAYIATILLLMASIFTSIFPDCYIEGLGLTPFKKASEYILSITLLTSSVLYIRIRPHFQDRIFWLILASIACTAASEISFTAYLNVYGFANMLGHILKLTAFILTYRALLVTGFSDPYNLIFRDLKQAETALQVARDSLEDQVRVRTSELLETETKYRTLIHKVHVAIVLHDRDGVILDSNPEAQELLGLTKENLLGRTLNDPVWRFVNEDGSLLSPSEYPACRVIRSGQSYWGKVFGIVRDGKDQITWVLVNAEPHMDESGVVAQVIVSFVDISPLKESEKNVALLSFALNNVHEAAYLINEQADFGYVNNEACHMLGYSREELSVLSVSDVDPDFPEDRWLSHWRDIKEKGSVSFEGRHRKKDGNLVPVEISANYFEFGHQGYNLALVRDITERKRAEDERKANLVFMESLDKVNRAIQEAPDLDLMMESVLSAVLTIFDCDRAWLFYPCNPKSPTFQVPMEVTKPEYPGAGVLNTDVPLPPDMAENLRQVLEVEGPVMYCEGTEMPINRASRDDFDVKSQMMFALYPKIGEPWVFGIHQCSSARIWTANEAMLFQEIGRRLSDGLSGLLAHRELKASESKYRNIIETSSEGVWFLDADANTVFVNNQMAEMVGYSFEEMVGHPVTDFMFDEDAHDHIQKMENRKLGESEHYERRFRHKDGHTIWTLASAVPIFDEDGQFTGAFAMFTDISERKAAEDDLKRMNERFALAASAARLGVWDWDIQSNRLVWDSGMYDLYGIGESDFSGAYEAWLHGIHPDDRAHCDEVSEKARRGEQEYDTEFRIVWPDGSIHYIKAFGVVIRNANGEPLRMTGVNMDITERIESEIALEKLNRELRALSNCNQKLVRAEDEFRLLEDICQIICDEAGYALAWVGYVENDNDKTVRPVACAGEHSEYLKTANISWAEDVDRGNDPAGQAIRAGQAITVQDIASEPIMSPWVKSALSHGFHSGIALPLKEDCGVAFGVLMVYSEEVNAISLDESRLMTELADDLAFGVISIRNRAERFLAEETLRASEKRFVELFNRAAVPLCLVNKNTSKLDFNQRFETTFGFSREDVPDLEAWWSLAYPDSEYRKEAMEMGEAGIKYAIAHDTDIPVAEYRVACKNGHSRDMVISGSAIGEDFLLTFFDITERKKAEDALFEAQEVFRALVENSPDVIVRYDRDCRRTYINPACRKEIDIPYEEVIGTAPLQRSPLPEESATILQNLLNRVLSTGVAEAVDVLWPTVNNPDRCFNMYVFPELDRQGCVASVMTIARDITERKQLELELRSTVSELSVIHENAPVAMFLVDKDGHICKSNSVATLLAGRIEQDLFGLGLGEVLKCPRRKDDERGCGFGSKCAACNIRNAIIDSTVAGDSKRSIEAWIHSSEDEDREAKCFLVSTALIPLSEQERVLVCIQDITERKRADEALKESEERYRGIFDNVLDGLYLVEVMENGCFRTIEVNPALARAMDLPRNQWIGKTQEEILSGETAQTLNESFRRCIALARPTEDELELRVASGTRVYVSTMIPTCDAGGRVTHIIGIFRDVTESKRVESALLFVAERGWQRGVESFFDALAQFLCDQLEMEYAFIDRLDDAPEVAKTVAIWAKGAISPNIRYALKGTPCENVMGRQLCVYSKGVQNLFPEDTMLTDLGAESYIGIPLWDSADKPIGLIAVLGTRPLPENAPVEHVLRLVATRAAAELERVCIEEKILKLNAELEQRVQDRTRALEEANKELEAFSYSVSHDLRAPLRHIDGFSEMILQDYANKLDEEGRGYLMTVRNAGRRMGQLIDDLLQLSRVSRTQLNWQQIDLSEMVGEVVLELRNAEPNRKVEVVVASDCTVFADRNLMRIVLENVLGNAWKYTGHTKSARIEFGVQQTDSEKVFFVRDNGAGFDMAYSQKLFGAFQRLHSTSDFPGTGIGLATVQRIIRRHNGRVWIVGSIGQGATLYFTIDSADKNTENLP